MTAWGGNYQSATFVAVRAGSAKTILTRPGTARATGRTPAIAGGRGCRASLAILVTTIIRRKCRRDIDL